MTLGWFGHWFDFFKPLNWKQETPNFKTLNWKQETPNFKTLN
ncbi:hypothetical protein C900_00876 [Fulvivirga imtechensis AK7]|uniref:Uncharacterized protein n=1 Tax=Fulvivirga imtechensis AK7 TaxID=1237149 RepID=L8JVT0_9BACT|nr:hypothetical protein C900_00876 [Fulvivirga imtechensis AK7]